MFALSFEKVHFNSDSFDREPTSSTTKSFRRIEVIREFEAKNRKNLRTKTFADNNSSRVDFARKHFDSKC